MRFGMQPFDASCEEHIAFACCHVDCRPASNSLWTDHECACRDAICVFRVVFVDVHFDAVFGFFALDFS